VRDSGSKLSPSLIASRGDLLSDSIVSIILFSVLGLALVIVGLAVMLDWNGCAVQYTRWIDAVSPRSVLRRRSQSLEGNFNRLLRQQRIIFGVIFLFGLALLCADIAVVAG
jgi:hypothetical protein